MVYLGLELQCQLMPANCLHDDSQYFVQDNCQHAQSTQIEHHELSTQLLTSNSLLHLVKINESCWGGISNHHLIDRDHFVHASNQWEMGLHCNIIFIDWVHTQDDPWVDKWIFYIWLYTNCAACHPVHRQKNNPIEMQLASWTNCLLVKILQKSLR